MGLQGRQTVLAFMKLWREKLINFCCDETPGGSNGKESACQCRRWGFNPWVRKIPWRRKWQPTPVFLPGKCHGQRSLEGYSMGSQRGGHDWATERDETVEENSSRMASPEDSEWLRCGRTSCDSSGTKGPSSPFRRDPQELSWKKTGDRGFV